MTNHTEFINYLASVNKNMLDAPENITFVELCNLSAKFRPICECVLGPIKWSSEGDYSRIHMYGGIPKDYAITKNNIWIQIALSNFNKIFTIIFGFDLESNIRNLLIKSLEDEGFIYAPYSLFFPDELFEINDTMTSEEIEKVFYKKPEDRNQHERIYESLFGWTDA
jgi:hypothetical protein